MKRHALEVVRPLFQWKFNCVQTQDQSRRPPKFAWKVIMSSQIKIQLQLRGGYSGFLPLLVFCHRRPTQSDTKWWRLKRQLHIYLLFPSVPPLYHGDLNSNTQAMREAGLRVALIVMPVSCWQISTPRYFTTHEKARCRASAVWITSLFIVPSFPSLLLFFSPFFSL